jgi:hypothetical protein
VDWRADGQGKKITREPLVHNKEEIKTQSHLMRFVDLLFLYLHGNRTSGGVGCVGRERRWKRPIFLEGKVLLNRRIYYRVCLIKEEKNVRHKNDKLV